MAALFQLPRAASLAQGGGKGTLGAPPVPGPAAVALPIVIAILPSSSLAVLPVIMRVFARHRRVIVIVIVRVI
jgi:hypothetical protein